MKGYIKDIKIAAFRGIRSLQLDDLLPINIITGDNNCGKTSVLEVLGSLEAPENFSFWRTLLRKGNSPVMSGGMTFYEGFYDLFDADSDLKRLEYTVKTLDNRSTNVVLTAQEDMELLTEEEHAKLCGFFYVRDEEDNEPVLMPVSKLLMEVRVNGKKISEDCIYDGQNRFRVAIRSPEKTGKKASERKVIYISPIRHAEGDVFLSSILNDPELYEDMLAILREYDKDIISINYDRNENSTSGRGLYKILSRSHKKALPLNVYGDGMKKAILLMSAVVRAKDGILLLDEFETAIHTSAMDKTFRWILETCMKLNVQVFLTSHSKEAIEKVLRCAPDLQNQMAVYTLYKDQGKTTARRLTGGKAIMVQDDMGLELR